MLIYYQKYDVMLQCTGKPRQGNVSLLSKNEEGNT